MNPRSFRFRLVLWYALWLAAVFAVAGVLLYTGLRHFLEINLAETQQHRAERIELLVARVQATPGGNLTAEITTAFAPEASDRFVRVARPDGTVLYQSAQPLDRSFDAAQIGPPPDRGGTRKVRQSDGGEMVIATIPSDPIQPTPFFVETGESLGAALNELHQLLVSLALGFVVVAGVALGGGVFLIGRALRPVAEITRRAEGITVRNLSERLPVPPTGDEIALLSQTLNGMIVRLEQSFQHNQRFLADASHELRTPLTILHTELEQMIEREGLVPDVRETLGELLEETERLVRIVETLFALSRVEAGQAQAEHTRLDFAQLAAATTEQMCLLAEDKDQTIKCDTSAPVWVEGDRARLKQVVVNLLDNAIKYTPAGGKVTLKVTAIGGEAVCEVADTGIGIPADALPHVFDRFFRVDPARNRDAGGAGIGLAIVKVICAAHEGRVEVESEPGRGSRFRVRLPLADQPADQVKPMNAPPSSPSATPPNNLRPGRGAPDHRTGVGDPGYIAAKDPIPSRSPKMRAVLTACLLLAAGLVTGRARGDEPGGPPTVAVAVVTREDLFKALTVQAEFRPYQEVDLHAKVSGYLKEIDVDIGDVVKAGDLIGVLEVPELDDDLARATAAEQRAEADQKEAHLMHARLVSVNQSQPNLIAQQDLDTAEAKDSASVAAVAEARADLEKYRTLVGYTRITAPFGGVITKRYADPGALIQAGTASQTQAEPLIRLSEIDRLRLDFPVSESFASSVVAGDPVEIRFDSGASPLTGVITRFTRRISMETRTMETEVEIPNPDLKLIPGMYATVVLKLDRRPSALAVPVEAVAGTSRRTVYVVNHDQKIEEREVKLGLETPDKFEVLAGLQEGDRVMIGNRAQVQVGEQVTARPVNQVSAP